MQLSDSQRTELQRYLGGVILEALRRPDITEVDVNDDGRIWTDTASGKLAIEAALGLDGPQYLAPDCAQKFGSLVATYRETDFTAASPCLHASLEGLLAESSSDHGPHGLGTKVRVQLFRPPVTEKRTVLMLRKLSSIVIPIDSYREQGVFDAYTQGDSRSEFEPAASVEQAILQAVRERVGILVAGEMGSGKTTAANMILSLISQETPQDRIVLLQDTRELHSPVPNYLDLATVEASLPLEHLAREAFRTSATRIVVGEVRGAEAMGLVDLWTSGHGGGVVTFHAANPAAALQRFDALCQRTSRSSQAPMIAEAIGLVLVLRQLHPGKRRITHCVRVLGFSTQTKQYQLISASTTHPLT